MVQLSAGRIVKLLLFLCLSFLSFFCSPNLEQTLAYINDLLAQNKKVAVFVIDMQEQFSGCFYGDEYIKHQIVLDQTELIEQIAAKEGVFIIDINFKGYGDTLPTLVAAMKKNQNYALFLKSGDSAIAALERVLTFDTLFFKDQKQHIKTDILKFLQENNIQDVILTGCFDGACIYKTAREALGLGFNVMVDRDMNIILDTRFIRRYGSQSKYLEKMREKWTELMGSWEALTANKSNFVLFNSTRYEACQDD